MAIDVAPSQARGLKHSHCNNVTVKLGRAFTGAWIETSKYGYSKLIRTVAPSQARGLKLFLASSNPCLVGVAPSQARGLKLLRCWILVLVCVSRLHRRVD